MRLGFAFVLGVVLAFLSGPATAAFTDSIPDSNRLSFTVLRDGKNVGLHTVEFHRDGTSLLVVSRIDIKVKLFGLVPLYRYQGSRVEVWRDGQLVAFEAETERTDEEQGGLRVRAMAVPEGLVVEGREGHRVLPKGALPATMWNRSALAGNPLFDPEDGHIMTVQRNPMIPAAAAAAGARHVLQVDKTGYELTYDEKGVWNGLAFRADDGSRIHYVRN
jgi:hypothetical protein